MNFYYEDIVPWGRSFDEYLEMFDLSDEDLARDIVGIGDGPASFNSLTELFNVYQLGNPHLTPSQREPETLQDAPSCNHRVSLWHSEARSVSCS